MSRFRVKYHLRTMTFVRFTAVLGTKFATAVHPASSPPRANRRETPRPVRSFDHYGWPTHHTGRSPFARQGQEQQCDVPGRLWRRCKCSSLVLCFFLCSSFVLRSSSSRCQQQRYPYVWSALHGARPWSPSCIPLDFCGCRCQPPYPRRRFPRSFSSDRRLGQPQTSRCHYEPEHQWYGRNGTFLEQQPATFRPAQRLHHFAC